MPERPVRKNVRLPDYDYSQPGYYYVTICTADRKNTLYVGPDTVGPQAALTSVGRIVEEALSNIPKIYPHIRVDKCCIMPNHIHVILAFEIPESGPTVSGPTAQHGTGAWGPTLGRVIGRFKAFVSRQAGYAVWQEDYYDHIISDEREYQEIWRYIDENPLGWGEDAYCV